MKFKCKYCEAMLETEWSLLNHQKKTKKCLLKQGVVPKGEFKCDICNKSFLYKKILTTHSTVCKKKNNIELKSQYNELQSKYNTIIEDKKILDVKYDNLFDKITTSALSKTVNNNNSSFKVDESQSDSKKNNIEIILCKLSLGNKDILDIPVRKDGMVNATSLCKAGNKLFGHYKENKQTKDYLNALEANIGVPMFKLIECVQGKYGGTWVHRKVAIHLAQWISPYFAVQVTNWIDELIVCGSVTLGKEKTNEELENKFQSIISNTSTPEKKLSIDMEPFHEKDVLYIYNVNPKEELNIQIPDDKDCYEFGVTSNIKQRDSAYNSDKCYDKVRLDKLIEYKNRNSLASGEKRIKNIVKDLGLKLAVKNKKECFMANKDEFDRIYDNIIDHSKSINDKSINDKSINDKCTTKVDKEFSTIELEKYRIDIEKEVVIEKYRIDKEIDIEKYRIDKDKEIKIMEMFENAKLTFEQMDKLLN